MAQITHSAYEEDFMFVWNIQALFDGIQKASGDIISLLMTANILLSIDYLCDLFRRVAILIPCILYHQYECYKLTNRIYRLTWKCTYLRNRSAFTSVPQQSMNNVSTQVYQRNSCTSSKGPVGVQAVEVRRAGPSSCASASASAHTRSSGWNTSGIGDMSGPYDRDGIPRVKSTPTMFCGKQGTHLFGVFAFGPLDHGLSDELARNRLIWPSHSSFHQNKQFQEMDLIAFSASVNPSMISEMNKTSIPVSKAKKFKRHHDDRGARERSHDSVVMNIFLKPPNPSSQKPVCEYSNLLKKRTSYNSRSEYSSTKSIAAERFPIRIPSNLMIRNSICKPNQPQPKAQAKTNNSLINPKLESECDRKWKNIFERAEALKNQRIKRMREMEIRKMQEKEKQRKIEIMKRRAIRAKIREENKRILMTDGAKKPTAGESNEICLTPVVVENNSLDSLNLEGYEDGVFCWDPSARVPILRVTQRTVRIERTSTKIGKNRGNKMKYSADRNFSRTDNTFNVLEASDKIVDQHSEFFLLPLPTVAENAECPDSKGFVYVETRSDKPHQEKESHAEKENPRGPYIPSRQPWNGACEVYEPVTRDDFPMQTIQVKSLASEFEKLAREVCDKKEGSFTKFHDLRNSPLNPGKCAVEVDELFPKVDLLEDSSPCEMKAGRPVIKRVKRRLIKGPNRTNASTTENAIVGNACSKDFTRLEACSLRKDVPDSSCSLDAKGIYLTSLKQKKFEVKKRLEDRLREQCEKQVEDGKSAEPTKHVETRDKQSKDKQPRPISAKNVKKILVKRNLVGGVGFSSKSSISLIDLPSEKRPGKKLGRPLFSRVYTRNSPSVSSLVLSENDPNRGSTETGNREGKGSKVFEHFSDSIRKRIFTGSRKTRRPRKKKLAQILDSFKSEIKEAITATASSLSSRLSEIPQREIEKSRSLDTTEDMSNNNSEILYVTPGRIHSDCRSGGDMDSQSNMANVENNRKSVSRETKGIGDKKDTSQPSNLRATVNPQPRWNNAAILRARYIEQTRPDLKRNRKGRGDNNCHSLPSSPRACPECSKQAPPPESSKSLPPTPR